MNGEDSGRIAQINSVVRSIITLMMGASVCVGFLFFKLINSDAFLTIAMAVILWWFKDKSDQDRAKQAVELATTTMGTTGTTTTTATTGPTTTVTTPAAATPAPPDPGRSTP